MVLHSSPCDTPYILPGDFSWGVLCDMHCCSVDILSLVNDFRQNKILASSLRPLTTFNLVSLWEEGRNVCYCLTVIYGCYLSNLSETPPLWFLNEITMKCLQVLLPPACDS